MARSASDLQVGAQIEGLMADVMVPEEIEGFGGLLDALAAEGFNDADVDGRTQMIHGFRAQDPDAKLGLQAFKGLTFLFFYGLPDEVGSNPNWEAIGFPGPQAAPPSAQDAPKTLTVEEVSGESATLTCDVCVVGSGAGGSVIAAECAKAGKDVLVLEMGRLPQRGRLHEPRDPGLLRALLRRRPGHGRSRARSALLAGSTVGGGTVVNYMNCVRTPDTILEEWESHGLTGLSDGSFVSRPHGGRPRAHQRQHRGDDPERHPPQDDGGLRRARLRAPADLAQRVGRRSQRALRVLPARLPDRLQALGDEDVAPGRIGRERPRRPGLPRRQDHPRGREARPASRPRSPTPTARPPR